MTTVTASGVTSRAAARPFGRIGLSELRQHVTRDSRLTLPSFDDVLADRVPAGESGSDEPFFWSEVRHEYWADTVSSEPQPRSARRWVWLAIAGLISLSMLAAITGLLITIV